MKKEQKLNSRQWSLYNLLKANCDCWYSKDDICDCVMGYEESDRTNISHNILNDIKTLNQSLEVDKIIVCKNSQFKLANIEEAKDYQKHFIKVGNIAFKNYWAIQTKIDRDNQGKVLSNQNQPIDEESRAKLFYETFTND